MPAAPIIANLIHLARTAARADSAGLWLLNDAGDTIVLHHQEGLPSTYVDSVRTAPVGRMTCGHAVLEKRPRIARDIQADPEFAGAGDSPIRACFSVPVIGHSGKVHGSMACHFKSVHDPSSYDIERNQLFAQLIAFALEEQDKATESAAD